VVDLVVPLSGRRFAHWVGGRDGEWAVEPGTFTLWVGTSVADLPLSLDIVVESSGADA